MRILEMNHFPSLLDSVKEEFPALSLAQANHVANLVTNKLRQLHNDIYSVDIQGAPFGNDPGYFNHEEFEACGYTVYLRVTVD